MELYDYTGAFASTRCIHWISRKMQLLTILLIARTTLSLPVMGTKESLIPSEGCQVTCPFSCPECSGNGVCISNPLFCRSRCVCSHFWTGVCCNLRFPRYVGGDPHMKTADGISFDYFGVGEFWDCMSPANDFGVQVRFFGFGQASLVGAVAVKVGHSIATITTPLHSASTNGPILRIDGLIQNITENTKKLKLNNGTVIVYIHNVQRIATEVVMVISIHYDTGAAVTVSVNYESAVGRLYLTVFSAYTDSFTGQTAGLCGPMDDNIDNDLTMSNGNVVGNDGIEEFVESWRIRDSFPGSGLYGSWSWEKSNFHIDDVMDPSYTDPSLHNQSYSTVNVSLSRAAMEKP